MSKLELTDTVSGYNLSILNDNFQKIESEFKNKTVYRDEPSPMERSLDMNGKSIINLKDAVSRKEAVSLGQVIDLIDVIEAAEIDPFIRLELLDQSGAGMIGNDDGADGANWTTVEGFIEKVSSSSGASLIGYQSIGTGAVVTTVQSKLHESVSVKDFGAVGDGVTDDTIAIQAAINSLTGGGTVVFSPGRYKTTTQLSIVKSIVLRGAGPDNTMLVPVGGFNVLAYTNAQQGAGAQSIGFDAGAHTSGYLIYVSGSDRTMFEDIIGLSPFNFMYIRKANACYISDTWINGIRGTEGIYWYGDASNRSDVLDINNVQLSCGTVKSATGIKMNGAVHTLSVRHIGLVNMLRGLHIYNDTSGEDPQFATVSDMQVDFPEYEGIRIEGAFRTGLFSDIYVNGSSAGDGVYIGSGAQQFSFKGGKIAGNWKSGMALNGRYTDVIGVNVTNNSEAGSAFHPGIEIGSTAVSVAVIGGTSGLWSGYTSNKQSYGIAISAGAIEYRILGVTLTGNVIGDYLDTAHYFRSVIFGNIESDNSNVILKTPGTGALKLDNGNMFSIANGGEPSPRRWMKIIGENDVTYYVPCY